VLPSRIIAGQRRHLYHWGVSSAATGSVVTRYRKPQRHLVSVHMHFDTNVNSETNMVGYSIVYLYDSLISVSMVIGILYRRYVCGIFIGITDIFAQK